MMAIEKGSDVKLNLWANVMSFLAVVMLCIFAFNVSCSKDQAVNKNTLKTVLRLICATACEANAKESCSCESKVKNL